MTEENPIQLAVKIAGRSVSPVMSHCDRRGLIEDFVAAMESAAKYCADNGYGYAEEGFNDAANLVACNDEATDDSLSAIYHCNKVCSPGSAANVAATFCIAAAGLIANAFEEYDNREAA